MPSFFTGVGDDGYTSWIGKGRIAKTHPRIEALGTLDEASATLGLARAFASSSQTGAMLIQVQRDLYALMAEVAADPQAADLMHSSAADAVSRVEEWIDRISVDTESPGEFIIPGDTPAAAAMDLARTVIRRAERQVAGLLMDGEVRNPEIVRYLNRLSSLCFALELAEIRHSGEEAPTKAKAPPPDKKD